MRLPLFVRVLVAAAVPTAVAAFAGPVAASAAPAAAPPAYSLTSSASPAALSAADCTADPACVLAPAPSGADDYAALQQAITTAGTGTVLLRAGTYRLTNSLKVPPNLDLRGAGLTATTLVMDPTVNWKNFSSGFLIRPADTKVAGSTNLIADLTVNGNCRTGAGAPDPASLPGNPGADCDFRATTGASSTTGGGIKAGDRWTIRQVRFTNLEYFKLWVSQTVGVRVLDNRFDNWGGAESGDEDNIGGGRNQDTVVADNQFDATIRGNSIDFVSTTGTTLRDNTVHTTDAVDAARGVNEYGNVYLEGVQNSRVTGNTLEGAHIVLSANAGYAHVAPNKDITEPGGNLVANNRILDSYTVGVAVSYADYTDPDGTYGTFGDPADTSADADTTDHVVRAGGANVIRDNVIERPRQSGIIVYGTAAVKTSPDTVTGNRVVDAGFGGATEYTTGVGRIDTSGIALTVGDGDRVYGNTVIDDQTNPTTWYGIQLGARKQATAPTGTILTGPDGETNTVTGVVAAPVRTAALAPEAPTGLSADQNTLTWSESYATANPIAGYRVFRDGVQMADLPVGSAAVPGNVLDDSATWTGSATTKVARSGSGLALTSTAAGQISVLGRKTAVTAGKTYTSVASFQAATTGRVVRAGLAFTDASGKVSRLATSNKATVDGAGRVTSSYAAIAPSGAVSVQAFLMVEDTLPGETHILDRLGLVTGAATEQFLPVSSAALVAGTYQVVAYRAGTGDFSAVSSFTIS
ncbi:right-handed parallel beta-helix repeat-containing protein [Actinoplanes sp. N902-109]|uniref:right-handed parallel beta-helix repeat-containing protein n=1 Tax=Actinoplanes sp. (strain N902-109) TaxID=649831 RepID=UPI0003293BD8|nr:right-handed parallel beta-helix repeat-containing protein [Actinoplanes sp. N902-109]AGL20062.1 hypothetical protein L083_6552 [Actinoplanes sp. N902-109]